MKYFAQVESSLKKGCNVSLGRRTLITGANGAGKSTIVQALQLATTGAVSDMEGRENVKVAGALARLFSSANRFSRVVLSDGTAFEWSMEDGAKAGSFKRPNHHAPMEVRWPLQDLMAILKGDSNTVSAWLEKRVLGELTEEDVLSLVPPAVRDSVRDFIAPESKMDFMVLAKKAKNEARRLRASATKSETTIESMLEGVAPPMMDITRQKLEADVASLAPSGEGVSQAEYDALQQEIVEIAEVYVEQAEKLAAITESDPKMINALKGLETYIELCDIHARDLPGEDCWVCGKGTADDVLTQRVDLQNTYDELVAASASFQQRKELESLTERLAQEMRTRTDLLKSLRIIDVDKETLRTEKIRRLAADDANRRTWQNTEAERFKISQERSRADVLTLIAKTLEKVGTQLLAQKKADFESRVSMFLPEGELLGVDLDASRVGLIRHGELHTALSGAEWSRVLLAIAVAEEAESNLPAVLVPDDRAWDPDTLTKVMEALSEAPGQVIIMSTVGPEKPVEGWTHVEV